MDLKEASFLLPVIDGKVYVGQRNTPPHVLEFGPVGGKPDAAQPGALYPQGRFIEKMGGHRVLSIADQIRKSRGLEYCGETAVREFCEEVYSDRKYPDDFKSSDITDLTLVGSIDDVVGTTRFICRTFIARVALRDYSLSPRELKSFVAVETISPTDCFPIAQLVLYHLRNAHLEQMLPLFGLESFENVDFTSQIADFKPVLDKPYFTELFYPNSFQISQGFY